MTTAYTSVFSAFGVLEHIFSFLEANSLVAASVVNRHFKEAARRDELWKDAARRLWSGKKGVDPNHEHPLFWRTLLSKDAVASLSVAQIRALFSHPLLKAKARQLRKCIEKSEMRRFLQVHMLDIMTDGALSHRFYSDLYFGSYACSIHDSKRKTISQEELCTSHGFDMYFKVVDEDIADDDRQLLSSYDGDEKILLYHHSTCFFDDSREFRMVVDDNVNSYHPTHLGWRWEETGTKVQVGPYPPLEVSRQDDWGWKLENMHVVLLFRDK